MNGKDNPHNILNVLLSERYFGNVESDYLIQKNKIICEAILANEYTKYRGMPQEDVIDVFISLHIILEVGINGLFRKLALSSIKKGIDEHEIADNLDQINFIDKTVIFIYTSSFRLEDNIDDANIYHSIIGKLKNFANMRNKLLHGHAIRTSTSNGLASDSKLKKMLTEKRLRDQVKDFIFIMKGVQFYLDCLNTPLTDEDKSHYASMYLSTGFIPHKFLVENKVK